MRTIRLATDPSLCPRHGERGSRSSCFSALGTMGRGPFVWCGVLVLPEAARTRVVVRGAALRVGIVTGAKPSLRDASVVVGVDRA